MKRENERYQKRVGSVVGGRWRIDSLLGWGSTSAVYAATHRNGHRAALKIIHQSLCADAATVERFLREAGIANAIRHRAIVTINDDGLTEEGCAYLVVELLEGETLEEVRERGKGRIELEQFAVIFEELMSAISAVHAAGVVHRDLKPGNVFITKEGTLKLLDFGTARILDRASGSTLSGQGLVIGTPAFMSPEQARGARAEVDAQSDVWSLGAMIFTVLSGEYVHAGKDQHARLLAAASQPARSLSTVAPSVDDRVAAVVDRALAHAKKDRWPDVQSMRIAFRHAIVASMPTMREMKAFADVSAEAASDDDVAPGTVSMSAPTLAADAASESATAPAAPAPDTTASEPVSSAPPESEASGSYAAASGEQADNDAGQGSEPVDSEPVDSEPVDSEPSRPSDSESDPLGVSSTHRRPAASAGIPLPALVVGASAMAAVLALVAFFVSGGDQPTRGAASEAPLALAEPVEPSSAPIVAAPSASFIVISAPDEPVAKSVKASSTTPPLTPAAPKWTAPATPPVKPEAKTPEKLDEPPNAKASAAADAGTSVSAPTSAPQEEPQPLAASPVSAPSATEPESP